MKDEDIKLFVEVIEYDDQPISKFRISSIKSRKSFTRSLEFRNFNADSANSANSANSSLSSNYATTILSASAKNLDVIKKKKIRVLRPKKVIRLKQKCLSISNQISLAKQPHHIKFPSLGKSGS